jgi:hypothetical protein
VGWVSSDTASTGKDGTLTEATLAAKLVDAGSCGVASFIGGTRLAVAGAAGARRMLAGIGGTSADQRGGEGFTEVSWAGGPR